MAEIVLGIGTSHTPLMTLPGELWEEYAKGDRDNRELVFPPDGVVLSFDDAIASYVTPEIKRKLGTRADFLRQSEACQRALDSLAETLTSAAVDVVVVVSDDQDEWFYEGNMPSFAVYWGETVPVVPRQGGRRTKELSEAINRGYGDRELTVAVPSKLGRFVIEYLVDHEFDVSHMAYLEDAYGGRIARRYPTRTGETDAVRTSEPRRLGLPHGYSFVVKRLLDNAPPPLLPIMQNTCYPPNSVRPARCYAFGRALAGAIAAWPEDIRVAVVASGGLSHFVVDEELDRHLLDALALKDAGALRSLPRHRLYSATSESLNWVTVGAALEQTDLEMDLVDYVPVYRTEAGTGGGWAFARWIDPKTQPERVQS